MPNNALAREREREREFAKLKTRLAECLAVRLDDWESFWKRFGKILGRTPAAKRQETKVRNFYYRILLNADHLNADRLASVATLMELQIVPQITSKITLKIGLKSGLNKLFAKQLSLDKQPGSLAQPGSSTLIESL